MSLIDLINKILKAIANNTEPLPDPIPVPDPIPLPDRVLVSGAGSVMRDFNIAGIKHPGPEDPWYHYPEKAWIWAEWCYLCRSECPEYTPNTETEQGYDCDDFADDFTAFCKRHKLSNAVWQVWGDSPGGGHAWIVFQCSGEKYELEPQTGVIWLFGSDPGYRIRARL